MNKKLIALAVAAASVAPVAMAQTANPVTLYGRAWVAFENVKADGGTAAAISSRNRVTQDGSSLFGFRGTEDLGGGLTAWFQMETEFRLDQNDTGFASRNSAVGLRGAFGNVLLGRWDSPMKTSASSIDPFGTTTHAGYNGVMADRGNFDGRVQNVMQWWSPNWSGFGVRASYGTNEGKTATVNPSQISFSATYTNGPFYITSAWEKHKDQFKEYATGATATRAGASETGLSLGGTFTVGPLRVGALAQRFKKVSGVGGQSVSDQKSQMINFIYTAGKHQFVYQLAGSKDGITRLTPTTAVVQPDSKMNSIGHYYNFSKRTSLITIYSITKNNATGMGNFGYGNNNNLAIAADQDPRAFSVGMRHLF